MVLLIDNYDSFSYNLYQLIGSMYADIRVVRNDEVDPAGIRGLNPKYVVISPGPGKPSEAGVCIAAIRELHKEFPILGICLGHQAIFEAFGGTVSYAPKLMHGKASDVEIDIQNPLFAGMPGVIKAARYHSLAALEPTLPPELAITARTAGEGAIMAVAHKNYPTYGLQFHPESILTPNGRMMVENFLRN
ncbi:MAG: aminodeoxychorismate/anthranilate synthase component II [Chitinispirillales bacterium]|jgi:anthranilate synthase component 2|nr:aminodeoxychorismate/anthranilate synthase component II [Chitinispirillales bacterium]